MLTSGTHAGTGTRSVSTVGTGSSGILAPLVVLSTWGTTLGVVQVVNPHHPQLVANLAAQTWKHWNTKTSASTIGGLIQRGGRTRQGEAGRRGSLGRKQAVDFFCDLGRLQASHFSGPESARKQAAETPGEPTEKAETWQMCDARRVVSPRGRRRPRKHRRRSRKQEGDLGRRILLGYVFG